MVRFLIIAAVLCLVCRWALGRWPWEYLKLGKTTTRGEALANARKLLAVKSNANRTEIIAAHKKLVAMVHPDRGGSSEKVHAANAARDLLLDELPKEDSET